MTEHSKDAGDLYDTYEKKVSWQCLEAFPVVPSLDPLGCVIGMKGR